MNIKEMLKKDVKENDVKKDLDLFLEALFHYLHKLKKALYDSSRLTFSWDLDGSISIAPYLAFNPEVTIITLPNDSNFEFNMPFWYSSKNLEFRFTVHRLPTYYASASSFEVKNASEARKELQELTFLIQEKMSTF